MIISHLIGGLGNQMFQYAASRALSLERDVPLYLDVQDFKGYALHNGYELSRVFNINTQLAGNAELKQVLGWRAYSPIRKKLYRPQLSKFRGKRMFVDTQFSTWRQIKEVPNDCYLMGNWQTEHYFKDFQEVIRADFSFRLPLADRNAALAEQISSDVAVSLHVRRGDYVANPSSLAFHGLCSLDYYRRAIDYISARVANPVFYIFSDDIPWVRENLHLESPCHYIDHNKGDESYNDMRLMSLCKHHIIANSSFSWWGAWLNPRTDKIVVAPQRWVLSDFDTSDIVPASWVKIE
jgi:hypothetical protein